MRRLSRLARALRESAHPWRFVTSRLLFHSGLSHRFTMVREGVRFRFWPSSMSLTLWADPNYGSWDREVIRRLVRPGDTVVDVGANIGFVALEAARAAAPNGRVYAYEPHPRVFAYLESNVRLNGFSGLEPRSKAVGSCNGTVQVSDSRADDQNHVVTGTGLTVPLVRLDDEFPHQELRLLKIDVEGFETDVLAGARELLRRTDWVYVEVGTEQQARYGRTGGTVLSQLEEAGFETWTRHGGTLYRRVSSGCLPEGCINVLGFRRRNGSAPADAHLAGLPDLADAAASVGPRSAR